MEGLDDSTTTRPLIVCGPVGSGKSHLISEMAEATNTALLHADDDIEYALQIARTPSFWMTKNKVVLIEDCEHIGKRMWAKINHALKEEVPIVFHASTIEAIPYNILNNKFGSGSVVILTEQPKKCHFLQFMSEMDIIFDIDIETVAETANSWRQVILAVNYGIMPDDQFDYFKSNPHPLSVLNHAQWNLANPDVVHAGLILQSNAWIVDGLSEVSKQYIETISADRDDRPPYRKRRF